jgi:hypothetical protein
MRSSFECHQFIGAVLIGRLYAAHRFHDRGHVGFAPLLQTAHPISLHLLNYAQCFDTGHGE